MISLDPRMRGLLSIVAVIDLMLFSSMTGLTVIAMVIGAIALLLGIIYSYQPAGFVGLVIVSVSAAAVMELPTLLQTSTLISAVIGLLVPVTFLTWLVLSVEDEDTRIITLGRRPMIEALLFAAICIVSVPLIAFVLSLLVPNIMMRMTALGEMAVVALVTTIGGLLLLRKKPSKTIEAGPAAEETV